jgi:hypothetical protein
MFWAQINLLLVAAVLYKNISLFLSVVCLEMRA